MRAFQCSTGKALHAIRPLLRGEWAVVDASDRGDILFFPGDWRRERVDRLLKGAWPIADALVTECSRQWTPGITRAHLRVALYHPGKGELLLIEGKFFRGEFPEEQEYKFLLALKPSSSYGFLFGRRRDRRAGEYLKDALRRRDFLFGKALVCYEGALSAEEALSSIADLESLSLL